MARCGPDPGRVAVQGVWQSQDLTVSGDLAARLTDARFRRLLRRAGPNLRSLVINGAPPAFTGDGLRAYAALIHEAQGQGEVAAAAAALPNLPTPHQAPPRLQTLDLARCPGVTGRAVLVLLRQLHIHDAPKAARLQRLALAGCAVDKAGGGWYSEQALCLNPDRYIP